MGLRLTSRPDSVTGQCKEIEAIALMVGGRLRKREPRLANTQASEKLNRRPHGSQTVFALAHDPAKCERFADKIMR